MLALLRRCRAMAITMVLLTPGITGSAVQWVHACPAEAEAARDHQHHGSDSSQSDHSQGCDCIGSCNTAGTAGPIRSLTIAAAVIQPGQEAALPAAASLLPSGTPSDLLPPATAPPLS